MLCSSWREGRQTARGHNKSSWGTQGSGWEGGRGGYLLVSEGVPERPLQEQRNSRCPLPPLPFSINTGPPQKPAEHGQQSVPNLLTRSPARPPPHTSGAPLPSHHWPQSQHSSPPSPRRPAQIPCSHHVPQPGSSGVCGNGSHFTSRPEHSWFKCTGFSPNTAHTRQRAPLRMTGLKDKAARTRQQSTPPHTGDTP